MTKRTAEVKELSYVERILKYLEKIRRSEIMYCEDHREFLKGEECYACRDEREDCKSYAAHKRNGP